ncbi:MAG: hypothetical protein MK085_11260 [Phycisphaerales bacterium]|nr:hypothetical protein [Phycisphaerales bacterium]
MDHSGDWETQWWMLFEALEQHVLSAILDGPLNAPEMCQVRFGFRRYFNEGITASEFAGQVLEYQLERAFCRTLPLENLLDKPLEEVLSGLASQAWLGHRAKDYFAKQQASGMTYLPEGNRAVGSLDVGEDGDLASTIRADEPSGVERGDALELARKLLQGERVLEMAFDPAASIRAIEETAAVQTWPRLNPAMAGYHELKVMLSTKLVGGFDRLEAVHAEARSKLESDRARYSKEVEDHPGMTPRTREDLDRKSIKAIMRLLVEPLSAAHLKALLGLSSLNAADRRNSNYRKARQQLFPGLFLELAQVETDT